MVDNVVVTANLWVLALECVQAVRASYNNFGCLDLVEHLNVLHGLHLINKFVASPTRRVTSAGLAITEDHEFYACGVK